MKNNGTGPARRGRAFEHRVRDELIEKGYYVSRSAGSRSPLDLLAVAPGVVLFVQCKSGNGQLGPAAWNELYDLAESFGATPVLATRPIRGTIVFSVLTSRKTGAGERQPMIGFDPVIAHQAIARVRLHMDEEIDAAMLAGGSR